MSRQIKIIENTVCGGKPVFVNQVVDASNDDAFLLINYGRAVAFTSHKEQPDVVVPLTTEQVTARDEKAARDRAGRTAAAPDKP